MKKLLNTLLLFSGLFWLLGTITMIGQDLFSVIFFAVLSLISFFLCRNYIIELYDNFKLKNKIAKEERNRRVVINEQIMRDKMNKNLNNINIEEKNISVRGDSKVNREIVHQRMNPEKMRTGICCPKCGSTNINVQMINEKQRRGCFNIIMWIILAIFTCGLILLIPILRGTGSKTKKYRICQNCGYNW